MTRHDRILNLLYGEAQEVEPVAAARIASAIVYKNEIVSIGYNRLKTHPFQSKFCAHSSAIYLHSENDAIVKALRLLSLDEIANSTMYIARAKYVASDKKIMVRGLAKPCCGCMRAISSLDIRNVCYTTNGGYEWL